MSFLATLRADSQHLPQHLAFFDEPACVGAAQTLQQEYKTAQPFPHVMIDDFLPTALAEQLLEEFPPQEGASAFWMSAAEYKKRGYRPDELGAVPCRYLFYTFNSGPFLRFLEALTGIPALLPDPYFSGGGFHEISAGGKLNVHADFSLQKEINLRRRVNVLIYLNKDWSSDYGGNLELWSVDMKRCVRSIEPLFNRAVIFNTDHDSFHGHPDPLNCPEGVTRRSIALYYYTASPTIRKEERSHTTAYQRRPGSHDARLWKTKLRDTFDDVVPPVLARWARRMAQKR